MTTLLIRNANAVATFDDADLELGDASIFIRDNVIEAVGPSADLPREADEVVNAQNCVVIPGLINTHHHMGTSNNSFVRRIVSSRGTRNPHVPERTLRLLRSVLLTLHPQK